MAIITLCRDKNITEKPHRGGFPGNIKTYHNEHLRINQ